MFRNEKLRFILGKEFTNVMKREAEQIISPQLQAFYKKVVVILLETRK